MEIKIGPYKLVQRTEYSKMQLYDRTTGENITKSHADIYEKIIDDYNKQTLHPEDYFEIKNDKLISFKIPKNETIKYVFIPNSICVINHYAFDDPFNYVHIPETVEVIKSEAFSCCKELKYIDIPDSIISIEECAFSDCINLETINISKNIKLLDAETFATCSSLKNIKLPENLEIISAGCFCECGIKEIEIPDNVSVIEESAFVDCKDLEYIKLPNNLKTLNSGLFDGCKSLKHLTIPDSVTTMHGRIFTVVLGQNNGPNNEDPKIENINIPRSLKSIIDHPFENSNVKSLTFNYDLKSLSFVRVSDEKYRHDLIAGSTINKLIINKNVKHIDPLAFACHGHQITSIDYLGTKESFEMFKNNNKELFKNLPNVNNINLFDDKELNKNINVEDIER